MDFVYNFWATLCIYTISSCSFHLRFSFACWCWLYSHLSCSLYRLFLSMPPISFVFVYPIQTYDLPSSDPEISFLICLVHVCASYDYIFKQVLSHNHKTRSMCKFESNKHHFTLVGNHTCLCCSF